MVNSGVYDGRKKGVSGVNTGVNVSERKQRWGGGQV